MVVGALRSHSGWVNLLVSSVTAPLRAKARPCTVAPVVTVTDVSAKTLPTKVELVPSVAELPTCQNTLQACAPLISDTVLAEAVVSVESVWKIHTEFGLPAPSSTSGPVRLSAPLLGAAYTPPIRTRLARSAAVVASIDRPAASLYAVVRSDCACCAAALVASIVPGAVTRPGGKPVMDVPGQSPTLELSTLLLVLVTVEPASTE